uniref:Chemokine interleukin-8-like domain-containing protein n=1 Tax=Gopherus agassizii TaxID=38772 RepID=A0A452IF20_9SAUR
MNGKLVVAILALFLIYAVVLARMGNELRCQCIDLHSKFIPPRSIRDVKLTPSGPHCQNTEIIAYFLILLHNYKINWTRNIVPTFQYRIQSRTNK